MNKMNSIKSDWFRGGSRLMLTVMLCLLLNGHRLLAESGLYPAPGTERQHLSIMSATDEVWMQALMADFQVLHPDITIHYREMGSLPLFDTFKTEYQAGQTDDLIISSAMDLQVMLVNDGFAATHTSSALAWLPEWASWRQQAFAFTAEPAVMVYNRRLLPAEQVPQNRFELIRLLREDSTRFQQKVGTYDIAQSGLGYLFASQDAQQASTWGRLSESLSRVQAQLYSSTSGMLQALVDGKLLLSYNVLGSYAHSWVETHPELGIVLPGDYTLLMSRVAFVSKRARQPSLGHLFLDHLLSLRGQKLLAQEARLYPIHPDVQGAYSHTALQELAQDKVPLKLIRLSPALLTYQDKLKKERFLQEWQSFMRPGLTTWLEP